MNATEGQEVAAMLERFAASVDLDPSLLRPFLDWLMEHHLTALALEAIRLTTPRNVYVVTSGWTDTLVEAVFTNKTTADLMASKMGKDAEVRESPLNPFASELAKGYNCYQVRMQEDGTVMSVRPDPHKSYDDRTWHYPDAQGGWPKVEALVLASDEQHALQLAQERRVVLLAEKVKGGKTDGKT